MNPDFIYKAKIGGINSQNSTLDLQIDLGLGDWHETTVPYTIETDPNNRVPVTLPPTLQVGNEMVFNIFKPGRGGRTGNTSGYNVELARQTEPKYFYSATVLTVHDGDTFNAKIQLGFNNFRIMDIRMQGINAPELSTGALGAASRDWLKAKIEGKQVILETWKMGKGQFEKYGRYLSVVYMPQAFVPNNQVLSVNSEMLTRKLAVVMPTGASAPKEIRFSDL